LTESRREPKKYFFAINAICAALGRWIDGPQKESWLNYTGIVTLLSRV
jgi:hypothetical protein